MRAVRRASVLASLGLAVLLAAADQAAGQDREFIGRVDAIDAGQIVVDRMGDKVAFERVEDTRVSGQGKQSWRDLAKDDWVSVHWKMMDGPRKAYRVDVLPPKE